MCLYCYEGKSNSSILFNRAHTVVFEFKNIKLFLKIGNEVYK